MDRYAKAMLTIIAACLLWLVMRPGPVSAAQSNWADCTGNTIKISDTRESFTFECNW